MLDRLVLLWSSPPSTGRGTGEAASLTATSFDGAPGVLILGEPGLGVRDAFARDSTRASKAFSARPVGEPRGVMGRGIEPLQGDQTFEVWIHWPKQKALASMHRGWQVTARCRMARSNARAHDFGSSFCITDPVWWAHQDSNLEQAGYEPAALTVELWARKKCKVQRKVQSSKTRHAL